jgi:hypothetical protein
MTKVSMFVRKSLILYSIDAPGSLRFIPLVVHENFHECGVLDLKKQKRLCLYNPKYYRYNFNSYKIIHINKKPTPSVIDAEVASILKRELFTLARAPIAMICSIFGTPTSPRSDLVASTNSVHLSKPLRRNVIFNPLFGG